MHTLFRHIRIQKRISLRELSDRTGVSVTQIVNIEKERAMPRLDTAYILAKALGVPLDSLIDLRYETKEKDMEGTEHDTK